MITVNIVYTIFYTIIYTTLSTMSTLSRLSALSILSILSTCTTSTMYTVQVLAGAASHGPEHEAQAARDLATLATWYSKTKQQLSGKEVRLLMHLYLVSNNIKCSCGPATGTL